MAAEESELVRTLKQVIELQGGCSNNKSLTLFGKKISPVDDGGARKDDCVMQSIQKLAAARSSSVHLKGLYKQHLSKRRARSSSPLKDSNDMLTLPLLNTMQDHEDRLNKRQKVSNDTSIRPMVPVARSLNAPQLTLFYKGRIYVYDDVPLDQARAMMVLAGNASSKSSHFVANSGTEPIANVMDLPQARKASLQRFLEKRKDRLSKHHHLVVKKEAEEEELSRSSSPCNQVSPTKS